MAGDHFFAVLDEVLDQLLEPHRARLAVHQRDVDHRDGDLARGVLVELAHDELGVRIPLEIDDDPALVLAAGVVVDVGDVLDAVVLHGVGDGGDDRLADDAVGDLIDDDLRAPVLERLGVHLGLKGQAAAAGLVAVDDAVEAADDPAGGEVGAGDDL